MDKIENFPLFKWSMLHPRIAAWIVLSTGMIVLLAFSARDVGLEIGNWIALIVMTVLVAGACIWIVSWEDEDDSEPMETRMTKTSELPVVVVDADEGEAVVVEDEEDVT